MVPRTPDRAPASPAAPALLDAQTLEEELAMLTLLGVRPAVIVAVDLSGFAALTQRWGPRVGSLVGRELLRRLTAAGGSEYLVAHVGGDAFTVVRPDAPAGSGPHLRELVESAFSSPISWDGGSWIPEVELGLATTRPPVPLVHRPGRHLTSV